MGLRTQIKMISKFTITVFCMLLAVSSYGWIDREVEKGCRGSEQLLLGARCAVGVGGDNYVDTAESL